jgi:hypothetical protein
MKSFLSLLFKLGIVFGIGFVAVASNPPAQQHKAAIAEKITRLQEKDVVGNLDRRLYVNHADKEEGGLSYHNYFVGSKVTDAQGNTVSFGLFKRVFVTMREL